MTLLFICSVVSNSLQHHVLQHTRLPWPSLPPGICSHSCPLSQWCHPTMSSSPPAHFSCPKYFPASGSFLMSQFFTSGGQSFWAWASVLLMNTQCWSPLGWTGLISLLFKGLSRVFSSTTIQNHQFFGAQSSLWSNSHTHTLLLEKPWLLFCFVFHILKSICLVSVSIHQKISFIRIGTWSFSSQHLGSCPAWWDN